MRAGASDLHHKPGPSLRRQNLPLVYLYTSVSTGSPSLSLTWFCGFRNLLVWFISAILYGDKSWTLLRGRTYLEVEREASHLDPLRI